MATAKTSKNTVASVNAKCDELENIVSALESRIAELETNLNASTNTSNPDDDWKNKVAKALRIMPKGEWACDKHGL
tara:strand:- start:365 stop:592 length:228 start_codon:yes stop_codon:yes gene_type:complete